MHQKISDRIPRTVASVIARCAVRKHCRRAYSGLVPMSPNTTPNAAKVIAGNAAFFAVLCIYASSNVDIILPNNITENFFALNQLFQLGRVGFFGYYRGRIVRCPSGLRSTPGKCVYVCAYRGFESLSHRQNFKDLNRKIKVFFYAEHSYLDLAQSLLHKNDSSQNRIICTTKWNIYSKINAWTWFKLELKQFLREVKINHQWSSRCNVYEAQFICGI